MAERKRKLSIPRMSWTLPAELKKRMANDPHNGKLGWWKVHGLRHSAMVKALTATKALKMAVKSGEIGDWELAEATWFAAIDELPDVFSI